MSVEKNNQNLESKSAYIITEYYANNLDPYFEAMDKDFLWLGPSQGQWVYGKDKLKEMYANESHNLTFDLGNMTTSMRMMGSAVCEVIVAFDLTTHYPDNEIVHCRERVHFTWEKKKTTDKKGKSLKEWMWMTCHISDEQQQDPRDSLYPVHLNDYLIKQQTETARSRRVVVSDTTNVTHYLIDTSIMWIENVGSHSIIHMTDGSELECKNTVNEIFKLYPKKFYRPHVSYLINLIYVQSITRFEITMLDQTYIPVPEKKYTKVKKDIAEYLSTHPSKKKKDENLDE